MDSTGGRDECYFPKRRISQSFGPWKLKIFHPGIKKKAGKSLELNSNTSPASFLLHFHVKLVGSCSASIYIPSWIVQNLGVNPKVLRVDFKGRQSGAERDPDWRVGGKRSINKGQQKASWGGVDSPNWVESPESEGSSCNFSDISASTGILDKGAPHEIYWSIQQLLGLRAHFRITTSDLLWCLTMQQERMAENWFGTSTFPCLKVIHHEFIIVSCIG